jgi:SAM-dependent methyltransferase
MINWAIRYQPILKELSYLNPSRVLEVGSGPEGLAMFWNGQVVGINPTYKRRPLHSAVRGSAVRLPFPNHSWSIVVSCDMLEHIHPAVRRDAVREMARVCDQRLLLAFPSGAAARTCYAKLAQQGSLRQADWLMEHIDYGLPEASEVATWLQTDGWSVRTSWHESVLVHQWLMSLETRRPIPALTYTMMRLVGPWLAPHLPVGCYEPKLRALLRADSARVNVHPSA